MKNSQAEAKSFNLGIKLCCENRSLPARLGHTGDFPGQSHFAETHAADAKLAHVAAGAAVNHVAVVQAHGRSVFGQLVETFVVAGSFQSLALLSVAGHGGNALALPC